MFDVYRICAKCGNDRMVAAFEVKADAEEYVAREIGKGLDGDDLELRDEDGNPIQSTAKSSAT